tara:strand:- start:307 stop:1137 length:831 start_codon:yes stop_codon:yes gene_type:complete
MVKNLFQSISGLLLTGLIISCGQEKIANSPDFSNEKQETSKASNNLSRNDNNKLLDKGNVALQNRKLIKTGSIRFKTDDFQSTDARIKAIAFQLGGYVSFEQQTNSSWSIRNDLEIRIPNDRLYALLDSISNGGYQIEEKNIKVVDVTNKYVDTESRIRTKKLVEEKYIEHLKKAKNIKDVLEIEQKAGYIREEIESAESQFRKMNDQISLSTLKIEFYQSVEQPIFTRENQYLKGLANGWDGLKLFIIFLINVWPLIIAGIIALFFIRRKLKKDQ